MDPSPEPYVPLSLSTAPAEDEARLKPWQQRRAGESEAQRVYRCLRSCWVCGHFEPDIAKLDEHEQCEH